MLITADLHLSESTEETLFGAVFPGIYELARPSREPVAILGDLWHTRNQVSVRLQNALLDVFQWAASIGIETHILPGNHDQYTVEGRHALEVFASVPGVTVYTKPTLNVFGLWLPHRKNLAEIAAALGTFAGGLAAGSLLGGYVRGRHVAFMHQGIRGAKMNAQIIDETGYHPDGLRNFDLVLLGHYHQAQRLGNCQYVGSPYQTKADEAGQAKGVWRLSPDGSLVFIDKSWGKRYHHVTLTAGQSIDSIDLSHTNPSDEIRVSLVGGEGAEIARIADALQKRGLKPIVTPHVQAAEARINLAPNASLQDYAFNYLQVTLPEQPPGDFSHGGDRHAFYWQIFTEIAQ